MANALARGDGAVPYTLVEASLADCIRRLATKPESQRHLYEIQPATRPCYRLRTRSRVWNDLTLLRIPHPRKTWAVVTSCQLKQNHRLTMTDPWIINALQPASGRLLNLVHVDRLAKLRQVERAKATRCIQPLLCPPLFC